MSKLLVSYDTNELQNVEFPHHAITEKLTERFIFMRIEDVREEVNYNNVLSKIISYTDPYQLISESIEMEGEDISMHIKVKDIQGMSIPRLIPYKRAWFIVGTGPHSKNMDIEMVNDMDEYARSYRNHFKGEFDFAYFCTLNEKLEIIDWHGFYDFYDEKNKKYVETARKEIIRRYPKYMKKIDKSSYVCIME